MNTASSHVRDPFRWQRSLEGSIGGHSKLSTDRPGHLCLLSQSPLCGQLQHETAFLSLRLHAYIYKLNVSSVAIFFPIVEEAYHWDTSLCPFILNHVSTPVLTNAT